MGLFTWLKLAFCSSSSNQESKAHEENNVVRSMANAKSLYKKLIIKAHPDKNPDKEEIAKALTEEINIHRYNYSELLKLKEKVETML